VECIELGLEHLPVEVDAATQGFIIIKYNNNNNNNKKQNINNNINKKTYSTKN